MARNKGIKYAKSDYLLFLDDDSRVKPDWILEHLKGNRKELGHSRASDFKERFEERNKNINHWRTLENE